MSPLPQATLNDLVALRFFEDGNRQEAEGVYDETEHVPVGSLDRVPVARWPMVLALLLLTTAAAAGAWWWAPRLVM
jgi:hypothetical protein